LNPNPLSSGTGRLDAKYETVSNVTHNMYRYSNQCFGSAFDWSPGSGSGNEIKTAKRQEIRHKNCSYHFKGEITAIGIWYTCVPVTSFLLKVTGTDMINLF
jgi:hypothetical protein